VRILLVSDLHYSLPQFDWVVRAAPAYDLVVLAGDHLDISSTVPLHAQCVVVLRYLALLRRHTRVVASSGNHDLTGPDAQGEQCALWLPQARLDGVATDGDAVLLGDPATPADQSLITVCPWWDGPAGRAALDRQLDADATRRPARWLWIYHWPPAESPTCWTGRRHWGDQALRPWLTRHQPDLVLTGHVHESPFKPAGSWADRIGPSWVLNAGRQIGPVPCHIVIDLGAGTATWQSMMGRETLSLADPQAPARTVF
jgi:Icc-related predicted phosphoesterase